MGRDNAFSVLGAGDVNHDAHDIRKRGIGSYERVLDNLQCGARLFIGVARIVGWPGAGAGDMDMISDLYGARIVESGVTFFSRCDVLAFRCTLRLV